MALRFPHQPTHPRLHQQQPVYSNNPNQPRFVQPMQLPTNTPPPSNQNPGARIQPRIATSPVLKEDPVSQKATRADKEKQERLQEAKEYRAEIKKLATLTKKEFRKWLEDQVEPDNNSDDDI